MDFLLAQTTGDRLKDFINAISQPAPFFILSCVVLAVFLAGYRFFTRPLVALIAGVAFTLFFIVSAFDPDFFLIISKPDNVPIVMMMFAVGFLTWIGFRQAAVNDDRIAKGLPPLESGAENKVFVWPDLVYTEFICLILCTVILIVWAVVLRAPLEQPADPGLAPNPAKAPWYFLGLQELLVYFDPWIAGVLLPGLIIVGLACIPYMDKNPKGRGYYTFKERPFAIASFMYGWVILWVVLIIFGTFLRGPNWNFFGPYEFWDPHRPAALINIDLRDIIWVKMLNRGLPASPFVREAPGVLLLLGYFIGLPFLLAKTMFANMYRQIGVIRYWIMIQLLLWMVLVPIKMALRWTLNLHYIVRFEEFFFNI